MLSCSQNSNFFFLKKEKTSLWMNTHGCVEWKDVAIYCMALPLNNWRGRWPRKFIQQLYLWTRNCTSELWDMGISSDFRRENLRTSIDKSNKCTGLMMWMKSEKKEQINRNPVRQSKSATKPHQIAAVRNQGLYGLLIPKSPNSNIPNKEMIRGFHPNL